MKKNFPSLTFLQNNGRSTRFFWFLFFLILCLAIFARFYKVTEFPPSLYWEEIALGYDAYSILKTGRDHLGNPPPLVAFESFGDYKPALYFYLLVPSIAVFGLNEFAVRLPTMIAGVLIVIGVGIIARLLAPKSSTSAQSIQLVAMGVTALSPWAILFSRAAWEVNVATCFLVWGVVLGLLFRMAKSTVQQFLYGGGSLLLFALSMYTYHSARMIAPLLALAMLLLWLSDLGLGGFFVQPLNWVKQQKKSLLRFFTLGFFFLFLIVPILMALREPTTKQRFAETSLFADGHVVAESASYQQSHGHALWSRLVYHRYLFYTREFLANYLKHFEFDFLFVSGDVNLRHSIQYFGQLYLVESIFLFLGLVFMMRNWRKEFGFLLFWLAVGIMPAALTKATPHALRILPIMPVYMLLISFGIVEFLGVVRESTNKILLSSKKLHSSQVKSLVGTIGELSALSVCVLYLVQFGAFWRFYSIVYPKLYSGAWQYGYRQAVEEVNRRKDSTQRVYFLREMDRPGMAYWFFSQTDPRKVQPIDRLLQRDQGPFLEFENITFINFYNEAVGHSVVSSSVESMEKLKADDRNIQNVTLIHDPNGKPVWAVYEAQ